MSIGWERLSRSDDQPTRGASRRSWRRDGRRLACESGDGQVMPRLIGPFFDGCSVSCFHLTVQKARFDAVALAHAARRSGELQDPTWHAARLPAAGACLGECAEIELIAGAAQDGRVLQLSCMLSSSCAVLCRCGWPYLEL